VSGDRWAINVDHHWSDGGYINFDLLRLSVQRLVDDERYGPGHVCVQVSILGLSLSVVRYGA
jgi:hypothetical protein